MAPLYKGVVFPPVIPSAVYKIFNQCENNRNKLQTILQLNLFGWPDYFRRASL